MVVSSFFSFRSLESRFPTHPLPALREPAGGAEACLGLTACPLGHSKLAQLVIPAGALREGPGAEAGSFPWPHPRWQEAGPLHKAGLRGVPPRGPPRLLQHRKTRACREMGWGGRGGPQAGRLRRTMGVGEGGVGMSRTPREGVLRYSPGKVLLLTGNWTPAEQSGVSQSKHCLNVLLIKDRIKFCVPKMYQTFVLIV